jgi:hypothetical protein
LGFGFGGWGLGDWGVGPIPNPQSPIPNPQSPIPNPQIKSLKYENKIIINEYLNFFLVKF